MGGLDMTKLFLGTGRSAVKQGGRWGDLTRATRCGSTNGKARCITDDLDFLTKALLNTHCLTGDHEVFWECAEHGPEALEKD